MMKESSKLLVMLHDLKKVRQDPVIVYGGLGGGGFSLFITVEN